MKEIEILVEVFDTKDRVKETLSSFNYMGLNKVIDEYYYDPKRDTLKPSKDDELYHCLRLRTKNNKHYITYKDDVIILLIKMMYMIIINGYIQMNMRQK
jgi:hypothetical protein